jgi:hypothetical protein
MDTLQSPDSNGQESHTLPCGHLLYQATCVRVGAFFQFSGMLQNKQVCATVLRE